jgi:hypothetical protein
MEHMVALIPDEPIYAQACVLPLSTAACGLFQPDQLGPAVPQREPGAA